MGELHNRKALESRRKALRNNPTPAEKALWNCLKGSKIKGRKFRRQHGIGPYIVDFYCPAKRLVIEVDGASHNASNAREYDAARQQFIEDCGMQVLRFKNERVMGHLDLVCEAIAMQLSE